MVRRFVWSWVTSRNPNKPGRAWAKQLGGPARCVYCGVKVSNESGPNKVNIDHAQAKANVKLHFSKIPRQQLNVTMETSLKS